MLYDILIVGGGPAGLTAAIYARRSGKSVLILEKEGFGGQIANAPRVENYPGAPSLSGTELAERMLSQALALDAETDVAEITELKRENGVWLALSEDGERYEGRSVILAVGAEHRRLGLPGEEELIGSGVSYCAVCDGSFYRGREVCVCGGGDSALQEALMLSELCSHVTLIHRRTAFRGEKTLLERLEGQENITVLTPYNISALRSADGRLTGLSLTHAESGEEKNVECEALFVCYGQTPATAAFRELVELEGGYAAAPENGMTAQPGLFVAGDCRRKSLRQLTTAVSDGANAAMSAVHYLEG